MLWKPLGWRDRDRRGREALADLRGRSLGHLLLCTAISYFAWHTLFTAVAPFEERVKAWVLFPLVIGGELVCYYALRSGRRPLAAPCFAFWGFACVAFATWLFPTPAVLLLYPLLALATAVTVHWSAAVITVLAEAGLSILATSFLSTRMPPAGQFQLAVLGAAFTVVVVWTLLSGLDVAIAWWLESYDEARRHLEDAREHRGRLVQALAQLDDAYYRLRRTNASLAEAWRAADLAERAKAEFITNISHELRTPLNLIVGFSEMMLSAPESYGDQPLPREYRGDLHAIYRSAQHLLALTDDVLDLAQAAINHLALIREPTDLANVVHSAGDIVREYIEIKGLQLHLHVEGLPYVRIDALRIRQVLLNLLTNAARFTDKGAIAVTLERAGEHIRVSVADTGRGLTGEQQERIFQEFQHVDLGAAREHHSTGLGLPISKKFIELHGGRMWVESTVGMGTTFRFDLPITDQPDPAPAHIAHPSTTERSFERALVLDRPNERLRRLLQRGLSGYRVFAAADPEQAAQVAFAVRATAIITVDGEAVSSPGPTPRIVCPLPIEGSVPGMVGVTSYLTKPVDRAALRAAIDQLPTVPQCILIVDDDLHSVRLLGRMLKADTRDYTLLTAHNGAEALERMRTQRPDLVLLDLMMPGCSGQEVLESMASNSDLADLPVIVVSGHAQAENSLRLPGELSLNVPEGFKLQTLIDVLRAVLASLPLPRAYLSTEPPADAAGPPGVPA